MFAYLEVAALYWPALALTPLLAWACVTDLRARTISNRLNAGIALLAPFGWLLAELTIADLGWRVGLSCLLFIAYAVAFRRIYSVDAGPKEEVRARPLWERQTAS